MPKEPQNCWDFWKCGKSTQEKCPAYTTNSGRECWMVVGASENSQCPKLNRTFKNCTECPWFKKLNPDF